MVSPKITVVVPCFNAEATIAEALLSVLMQTEDNLEVIVIDDNSSDNTVEIIEYFCRKDQRLKFHVNKKNIGVANTKNRGLALARGTYLGFLVCR